MLKDAPVKTPLKFVKMYVDYWVGEYKIYQTLEEFLEVHPLLLEKRSIEKLCSGLKL